MDITLAIDYGTVRVGLALCVGWIARPLEVLPHRSLVSLIDRVLKLAKEELVTQFLVGLPVNADGSEGPQAEITRAFANQLALQTTLPVLLWNEYGSSMNAQQQMIASNTRRKKRRKKLDAIAAAVFLQEFVDDSQKNVERVLPQRIETS